MIKSQLGKNQMFKCQMNSNSGFKEQVSLFALQVVDPSQTSKMKDIFVLIHSCLHHLSKTLKALYCPFHD